MCKKKPGPRCYNHARPKFEKAQAKTEEAETAYREALAAAGGDKSQVPEHLDESRKRSYADRYESMRQYYSTPRARDELKTSVIPQAQKNLQSAETAYEDDPSEANKKARTVARSEATKYRNLLTHGERRWSQSNADLRTHEARNAAMDRGDYDSARYDNVDLSRASSWDTLNSKPKWSGDRKAVRREMRMETPNQERISAVSDMQIKGHKGTGFYVETTTHATYGYTSAPDSSASALPAWQNGKNSKVKKDKEFEYTKVRTVQERSQNYQSYAEAKDYATGLAGGGENNYNARNHLPAQLARQARERSVAAAARRNGIQSQEDYNRHMAQLHEEQRRKRAEELNTTPQAAATAKA